VFVSNRSLGNMLWTIASRGDQQKPIAIAGRNVRDVSVASGMGMLVYTEAFRNTNIWRADLSQPQAPTERLIGTPRWSPDGQQIVFDVVKEGRSAIYIIVVGGGPARLFAADQHDNMMPSWSAGVPFTSQGAKPAFCACGRSPSRAVLPFNSFIAPEGRLWSQWTLKSSISRLAWTEFGRFLRMAPTRSLSPVSSTCVTAVISR
jgi:hypothetical protein